MLTLELDLASLVAECRHLAGSVQRADLSGAMQSCALAARSAIARNFAEQHAPDGTPWTALTWGRRHKRDIAAARKGGRPQILRDTGVLLASYLSAGPGHVERITRDSFEVGSNLDRAAIHHFGGVIRARGKMLAIPLDDEAIRAGSPRNFPRALFVPKGGRVLAEAVARGKGKKQRQEIIPHYFLTRSVTIPARPAVGWTPELEEDCAGIVADHLAAAAGGGA